MKIFNRPYEDGLAELITYYAGLHKIMDYIITMPSIRSIIVSFYYVLVSSKELDPIESLEKSEKEKLWKIAPKLNLKERKDIARATYLMGKIVH